MSHTIIRIDSAPIRMNVSSAPVRLDLLAAQGPAGPAGPAGPNVVNASTTSNGTASLSVSSLTTVIGSVSGILNVPTATTATSTLQVASTAFVQQELAAGTAVAKNLGFLAHNGSGVTIAKGSIVYINGAVSGVPRITKAQANNETNSARTIGFVKADIVNGANGFVITEGELLNVSTADSIDIIGPGIQLYLSPTTPGAFTRTKPSAPYHLVYVGVVVTASTGANLDGKILVGIQNGYELNEIHDVAISSPAAKQVIKRNAGSTLWINEAIAASDVTGLGTLATQSGTFSGTSSGTNTGDQDLSNLLSRRTYLEVNGTTPLFGPLLVDQDYLTNGRRVWLDGSGGSLLWDGFNWVLELDSGGVVYQATKASSSYEPWLLTGWTVVVGSGQPTFDADPFITNSADPLGSGVSLALYLPADTNGGFLTAGTGGTLPITRGGTGATTAGLARTALGSGATGDPLFTAASASAARTILEINRTRVTQALDLPVLSLTTPVATDLQLTLTGGVDYLIRGVFDMVSGTQAAGQKLEMYTSQDVSEPFGTSSGVALGTLSSAQSLGGVALASLRRANFWTYTGASLTRRVQFEIVIKLVSTGVISIAFAQVASGATASVFKAGSFLTAEIL